MKNWIKPLNEMGACSAALEWCEGYESLVEAWAECKRGDWMLWLLGRLSGRPESASRKRLVLTACQCVRLSLGYVTKGELRPLRAIEIAEAWAKGEGNITLADVRNAAHVADVADVAADAAYVAYAPDYAAAYAAAYVAAYAAHAAAHAADYDAAYDAGLKTLAKCADIARQYYPVAPKAGQEKKE